MAKKKKYKRLSAEDCKKRDAYAKRLLAKGETYARIFELTVERYGTQISSSRMAAVRAEMNNGHHSDEDVSDELIVFTQPELSPKFDQLVAKLQTQMQKEGVAQLIIRVGDPIQVRLEPREFTFEVGHA